MKNASSARNVDDLPILDETDRKIVGELTSDGRVSFAELGRRVNLSSPAVAERVQRLQRAGVVTRYRPEIDPHQIGYPLTANVPRQPAPGHLPPLPDRAPAIPQG